MLQLSQNNIPKEFLEPREIPGKFLLLVSLSNTTKILDTLKISSRIAKAHIVSRAGVAGSSGD
jgi:hypothetical protein